MTLHWPGPNQSFSVPALCAQSSFILDGTTPFSNDQQNSQLRNGARMSTLPTWRRLWLPVAFTHSECLLDIDGTSDVSSH